MRIGFIDYYLDEWHALNYPAWIKEQSQGRITVTHATAITPGENHGRRNNQATAKELGLEWVDTIEELLDSVDGVIVLSPDNPEQHEALAEQVLPKGKRTYIDKTFAPDLDTAKRIFALADQHQTPMYSTSALRYAKAYKNLCGTELATIQTRGPLTVGNYAIHQIEPMLMLMGLDVDAALAIGSPEFPTFVLKWKDGRTGTMTFTDHSLPFYSLVTPKGQASKELDLGDNFFLPFIDEMIHFFETGSIKVQSTETLANIAVLEALQRAQDIPGQWTSVRS